MAKSELPQHDPVAEQHLLEIGQWCHDIRHVAGKRNAVSDWLSRPPHVPPPDNDDLALRPDAIDALANDLPATDVWDILATVATTRDDLRQHLAIAAFNGSQRWGVGAPASWTNPSARKSTTPPPAIPQPTAWSRSLRQKRFWTLPSWRQTKQTARSSSR